MMMSWRMGMAWSVACGGESEMREWERGESIPSARPTAA